jgi:retron-type reverse transcriptase
MARQSMSPTQQQVRKSFLFSDVTSRRALGRAWTVVKPHVVRSKDPAVRAAAERFGNPLDRSIRDLQAELRSGRFKFEPQHGILKRNKSTYGAPKKPPRPIVVAPVRSRVVQRAILDICQTGQPKIARRLGSLPAVIATATSVGGLPGRGVPEAMALISGAIMDGARWFVRSDLKKFFQTIPKPCVENFLRANIADGLFVDLFMRALATELENEDEVRQMIHLFPLGDTGVPQGSALSALCANIVLAGFDAKLNGRALHTIRYLDDFVILGPNKRAVLKGWARAQTILAALGMECHDPSTGTGKAAMGEICDGFEFLSFHIDNTDIYPSTTAQKEFLSDIRETIRRAKHAINGVADEPRRAEPRFIQSLNLLDRKIRGWGDAFKVTTKRVVFAQLDAKIDPLIAAYRRWFSRVLRGRSQTHQHRLMGVALLADTPRENRKRVPGVVSMRA